MSTNAYIAIETGDGYIYIYLHNDGMPSHVLETLRDNYITYTEVMELIKLGDLSVLGKSIEVPEGHTWATPVRGYTVAYARDRNESNCEPAYAQTIEDMIGEVPYTYVFMENGKWAVYQHNNRIY